MDKRVKDKWVDALRTGQIDGEPIAQVDGVLRGADDKDGTKRMCCLGVLSEIARREGVGISCQRSILPDDDRVYDWYVGDDENSYLQDTQHLPDPVVEWAGLSGQNPKVAVDEETFASLKKQGYLSDYATRDNVFISIVNDYTEVGFDGIADLIERNL